MQFPSYRISYIEAWRSNRAANRKVKTIKGDLESVGELGKETEVIVKRLEQECENLKIQHQVLINENKEILQGLEKIYRFMELESMLPREDRKSS